MENIITKQLLSKVLKIEIISYQMKQKNIIGYEYNKVSKNEWSGKKFCNRSINIYELAYKCKQWAFDNGYELRNGRDIDAKKELCYFCEYKQERQIDYAISDYFLAETEPEAIFKACQWILDRKIKG